MRTDVGGSATRLSEQDIARYTGSGAWRNVTLAELRAPPGAAQSGADRGDRGCANQRLREG